MQFVIYADELKSSPAMQTEAGRKIRIRISVAIAINMLALVSNCSASAADIKDMLGRWTWQKFKIEVTECAGKRVCARVIAGPKNVGLEIFSSDLTSKNGNWFGQIVNPETGTTYNTRMQLTGSKTWRLDGCTASNVCLSGEFIRAE
jgi:uncharacterized protein (DUF2147 family)